MSESTQLQLNSNWEEAKKIIDSFQYGPEIERKPLPQATHKVGTKTHNVDNYEVLFNPVLGFEFKGYFVHCRTCNTTRQKRMVLFNTNTAYVKDIVKDDSVTND